MKFIAIARKLFDFDEFTKKIYISVLRRLKYEKILDQL